MANFWTDWPHATFLLLHRWLGYIAVIQGILHSVIFLYLAIESHQLHALCKGQAWAAGSVATIAMGVLVPLTSYTIRKRLYEAFLICHVFLSTAVILGIFLHIYYLFGTWTTEFSIHVWGAIAFWVFERVIRIIRIGVRGFHTAQITVIDNDYIRIDLPDTQQVKGHVYLYFPTLTWRFWENHPFSVVSRDQQTYSRGMDPDDSNNNSHVGIYRDNSQLDDLWIPISPFQSPFRPLSLTPVDFSSLFMPTPAAHKAQLSKDLPNYTAPTTIPGEDTSSVNLTSTTSIRSIVSSTATLQEPYPPSTVINSHAQERLSNCVYVRSFKGATRLLRRHLKLPVLIESGYGPLPNRNILDHDMLICIAGGVGITAILPHLQAWRKEHMKLSKTSRYLSSQNRPGPPAKLYWGCRSAALVQALSKEIEGFDGDVVVGARLKCAEVLWREVSEAPDDFRVAIVVSGPRPMAEEVRKIAVQMGKMKRAWVVSLVDECFAW